MPRRLVHIGFPEREPLVRRWLADARQDLRYAARQLRRTPGFTALVVATLAIGIGANVTMAGAVDRLLLRAPAHVRDARDVARLLFMARDPDGAPQVGSATNYPTLLDLAHDVPAFADVAATSRFALSLGTGADAVPVRASLVSPSYFTLLGARAALGRLFGRSDGFPDGTASGGPPLAVLADGFWQRQFAGDPRVLGRALRIGALTYTVVGVAPPGFQGVESDPPDVWLPMTVALEHESPLLTLADRGSTFLAMVARLRPGVSRAVAEQQATAVWRRTSARPGSEEDRTRLVLAGAAPGQGPDMPRAARVALWLAGISTLVLLIACANVASLLLGRAFVRRREIAARLALGAARGRLVRQLLVDGLLLATLGGTAALALAAAGGRLLRHLLLLPRTDPSLLDGRLFAFTALVVLGTGALISLAPVAQSAVPNVMDMLRTDAGSPRASRARTVLLAVQAATCMLLLVVAGLFSRSFARVVGLDLGVDLEHTVVARFDLGDRARPRAEIDATLAAFRARVGAIPGVERSAFAEGNPYAGGRAVDVHPPGRSGDEFWHPGVREIPIAVPVDSGFFRAVGTRSLRGRDFAAADRAGGARVAIVNAPLARLLWPGRDPLGQCVLLTERADQASTECVTVVGVLDGFWKRSILARDVLAVYVPIAQRTVHTWDRVPSALYVRVRGIDARAVLPAVRGALLAVRPDLPAVRVDWMRDVVDPEIAPWRLAATMFSLFGVVALLIAAVGLYGVVAFAAAQRSREIAVRVTLGAPGGAVLRSVAGAGLRAVVVGLLIGAAAALAMCRWLGALLFHTSPSDPTVIGGVGCLLVAVALVAAAVPATRALRTDPASVLRETY